MTDREDARVWNEIQGNIRESVQDAVDSQTVMIIDYLKSALNPIIERLAKVEKIQNECKARIVSEAVEREGKRAMGDVYKLIRFFTTMAFFAWVVKKVLQLPPEQTEILMEGIKGVFL